MAEGMRARRLPAVFVAAVLVALIVGIGAVAVAVHNAAGPNSPIAVPTPLVAESPSASPSASASAATSPTPSGTPLPAPVNRCQGLTFGAALAPLNAPADVHVYSAPPPTEINSTKLYEATITTPKGTIVLCLDPQLAPNTVNNFVALARNHFYDGLKWHRVVADFVIQGGDPKGDGSGGPGYQFADEPVKASYAVGAVAMANSGKNTNGSQFFICIGSQCPPLPPSYNLFGLVVSGQDVADKIAQGDAMTTITVAESTS
jgi:peptidyl-prolyl cis-trans isomerase B (cyclophilin B)